MWVSKEKWQSINDKINKLESRVHELEYEVKGYPQALYNIFSYRDSTGPFLSNVSLRTAVKAITDHLGLGHIKVEPAKQEQYTFVFPDRPKKGSK